MQTIETRDQREPQKVQMAFVVTEEMRHAIKLTALQRGMTVREYLTDLVLRDQEKEVEATR